MISLSLSLSSSEIVAAFLRDRFPVLRAGWFIFWALPRKAGGRHFFYPTGRGFKIDERGAKTDVGWVKGNNATDITIFFSINKGKCYSRTALLRLKEKEMYLIVFFLSFRKKRQKHVLYPQY